MSSDKSSSENTGFFSGFFKMLSSFAFKLNPFAEKQLKEMASPSRPDWRKLTTDIWHRSLQQLPLDVDLPRLAARVSLEDHRTCADDLLLPVDPNEKEGNPALQKPERSVNIDLRARAGGPVGPNVSAMNAATTEAAKKSYRAVCELLYEVMFLLGGGREKADAAKQRFVKEIPEDSDITVQKVVFKNFLADVFGEDTPAGRCLKAVNQAIIAPGNKEALVNLLPGVFFKDSQQRPWEVVIRVFDDHTEVSHQRGQCSLDNRPEVAFSFVRETAFVFDKNLENMTEAHLYVDEYSFGPKTTEACKAQFSKLFDANLRPVPNGTVAPARVVSNIGRRVTNLAAVLAAAAAEKKDEGEATTSEEAAAEKKDETEATTSEPKEAAAEPKKEEENPAVETKDEAAPSTTGENAEAPAQ